MNKFLLSVHVLAAIIFVGLLIAGALFVLGRRSLLPLAYVAGGVLLRANHYELLRMAPR